MMIEKERRKEGLFGHLVLVYVMRIFHNLVTMFLYYGVNYIEYIRTMNSISDGDDLAYE